MLELEELKNKYIKYSEEITEDTFNKILDRAKEFAKEICPNLKTYRIFDDHSFDSFRLNRFFRFSGSFCSYGVDNNSQDAKEIEVSDILGKEPQFEVGKWYRNLGTDKKYIAKLGRIKGNKFWHNECIFEGRYQKASGYLVFEDDIRKVTDLSEIQQYLPDNHPDKIVKPIEKWSVGSYVVALVDYTLSKTVKKGDIKKITSVEYASIHFDSLTLLEYQKPTILLQWEWFVTLSEAETFSKELLEPKSLIVNDLVEGEIYYHKKHNNIVEWSKGITQRYLGNSSTRYCEDDGRWTGKDLIIANKDQKHWLLTCIKQDKFIPKEDLSKYDSEGNLIKIKEYVKCDTQKQLSDILPNYSKVDRNVYYEVETQEQCNEILDWLESNGEQVFKGYNAIGIWRYVCFENDEWSLNKKVESQLSKAEFQFKNKDIDMSRWEELVDVEAALSTYKYPITPEKCYKPIPEIGTEIKFISSKEEPQIEIPKLKVITNKIDLLTLKN